MYKKIELHNHSVESDGNMTVENLVSYLAEYGIENFSLTDHNTISGIRKLQNLKESGIIRDYISGYELTSYYGHLLCQNVTQYIPWDDIDKNNGDKLLKRVHEAGGLAGIAHPFSVGAPISNGMRWTMKIHDYSLIDFVEVINNAHPMQPDNRKAIAWWESLIFSGCRICAVSGMDLHRPCNMNEYFTTYIHVAEEDESLPLSSQLETAVQNCSTWVTKGPIIESSFCRKVLTANIHMPGSKTADNYLLHVRTKQASLILPIKDRVTADLSPILSGGEFAVTLKLYQGAVSEENLAAIAPPIFLR